LRLEIDDFYQFFGVSLLVFCQNLNETKLLSMFQIDQPENWSETAELDTFQSIPQSLIKV